MPWRDGQARFAAALRRPHSAVPQEVGLHEGTPQDRRFAVYRNNVVVSLGNALAEAYPIVREVVGAEFFSGMARLYVDAHLPRSPVMHEYGADFPEFIGSFPPAAALPYLADIARLELARRRAYHAADATPIAIDRLAEIPEDRIEQVVLIPHPSLQLVRSTYPVHSIWEAHQSEKREQALALLPDEAQVVMILRPALTVVTRTLDAAEAALLEPIIAGEMLSSALHTAQNHADEARLGSMLAAIFNVGAIAGIAHPGA